MPSAPFLLGGRRTKKAYPRPRAPCAAGQVWARAICQKHTNEATGRWAGNSSEVAIAGGFDRQLVAARIEQTHPLAALDRADRGDRQRQLGPEFRDRLARFRRRDEQQLVIGARRGG